MEVRCLGLNPSVHIATTKWPTLDSSVDINSKNASRYKPVIVMLSPTT